jgi:hypothetical protein
MFLLQSMTSPVVFKAEGRLIYAPKFPLRKVLEWAAEIKAERVELALQSIEDPHQRAQFVTFYPPIEPTIEEMMREMRTPSGAARVVKESLTNAKVVVEKTRKPSEPLSEEQVAQIIDANWQTLPMMAAMLAEPNLRTGSEKKEGEEGNPEGEQPGEGLTNSAGTGPSSSQPSQSPTPEQTPSTSPSAGSSPSVKRPHSPKRT